MTAMVRPEVEATLALAMKWCCMPLIVLQAVYARWRGSDKPAFRRPLHSGFRYSFT